jgi:YVTN family beta-propeller protein
MKHVTVPSSLLIASLLSAAPVLAVTTVIQTIPVGSGPHRCVITPDGNKLYNANRDSNEVYVIDLRVFPHQVLTQITVGASPSDLAIEADGQTVYVADRLSGSIFVIDAASNAVVDVIDTGGKPTLGELAPDEAYLCVVNDDPHRFQRVDLDAGAVETFFDPSPEFADTVVISPMNSDHGRTDRRGS